jgi:hypothetical protein
MQLLVTVILHDTYELNAALILGKIWPVIWLINSPPFIEIFGLISLRYLLMQSINPNIGPKMFSSFQTCNTYTYVP